MIPNLPLSAETRNLSPPKGCLASETADTLSLALSSAQFPAAAEAASEEDGCMDRA
jgi:hypothetical protein